MGVKNNVRLIFDYFRLNLKKEWKYKSSFIMQIVMMVLNDAFFLIQWYIIFNLVSTIGGYGFNETMMLWAVSAGGFGISRVFFAGAWNLKDIIYEGRLDVFLTQPKNVLLNVCCSRTEVACIGDIIYPYVVLILVGAPWHWYLIMIPAMILAGLLYVSVYVSYISICFYIKGGDAVARSVEGTINKAAQYPPSIYNFTVKALMFTLIPTFFYSFVPVEYFFLNPNIWWILGSVIVTALWIVIAFITFNKGLKKYNSGSLMGGRL